MPAPLDIDVLRTFHTIVRLGQFRAASLQLNRSPSAVSSQIRRLEEQTGGRLFERDNQAVRQTSTEGECIADVPAAVGVGPDFDLFWDRLACGDEASGVDARIVPDLDLQPRNSFPVFG